MPLHIAIRKQLLDPPSRLLTSRVGRTGCLAALILLALAGAPRAEEMEYLSPEDPRLADLIRNVAAAELLYEIIDVSVDWHLESSQATFTDEQAQELGITESQHSTQQYVSQNGLIFYEDLFRTEVFGQDEPNVSANRHGYDGERTVNVYWEVVNIEDGRTKLLPVFRPHMLPRSGQGGLRYRFSAILDGSCKGCTTVNGRIFRVQNVEAMQGRGGDLIRVTIHCVEEDSKRPLIGIDTFVLSTQHNYLPIEYKGIASDYSSEIPLEVFEMSRLEEVEPGVFLPRKCTTTVYDELSASEGVRKVSNVTTWNITRVDLPPSYPPSKFSDIEYPANAAVYYIKNGQVADCNLPQSPRQSAATPKSQPIQWLLLANGIGLLAVSGVVLIRRARRRSSS